MPISPADNIDWMNDELPGERFASSLHALRARGPVVQVAGAGGLLQPFYIVSHEALAEAFKDGERFPPGYAYQTISQPYIGETFMSMDEPGHARWRSATTPAFRRTAIEAREDADFARHAHALVDRIAGRGDVDFCADFTRIFSFMVICQELGLPAQGDGGVGIESFYQLSMDLMFGGRDLEASRQADQALMKIIGPVLDARRAEPADDVISQWLRLEIDGVPITDDAILAHVRLVFTAGATTTSDALGSLVYALLTHPQVFEACRDDEGVHAKTVDELLRWMPPVAAQPRLSHATEGAELAGVTIPPGAWVLFGIAAANRDPEVFADPDRFDIERDHDPILTFGPGLRTCPGMHLARKNLRVALGVLCERLPGLELVSEVEARPRGVLLRGPARLPVSLGAH